MTLVGTYQGNKPLPEGVNVLGETHHVADSSMVFLCDLTHTDSTGEIHYDHEIFDSVFAYITGAQKYILIDMFLFNSYKGPSGWSLNELSYDLSRLLIEKKKQNPGIQIDFITDPVNTLYGGVDHPELSAMQKAGVNTIETELTHLRDSNPLYSPIWRTLFQWLGNSHEIGILPNAFDARLPKVSLRSYLAFLNLKANHRKIFVCDSGSEMISIITSANPHSSSADFSNIGIIVKGALWKDIYYSERGVANFSGSKLSGAFMLEQPETSKPAHAENTIQLITEGQIRDALIEELSSTSRGDSIKIAMFYLSKRTIINALLKASSRGAKIQIILDPNKDGFGFHHNGTPNRPVARELIRRSKGQIRIRWYHTRGEQFHSKIIYIRKVHGPDIVVMGSANMTRKNLDNYNMETDVLLTLSSDSRMTQEVNDYFDLLWNNQGAAYTTQHTTFEKTSIMKTVLYRFQEFTGLSTY